MRSAEELFRDSKQNRIMQQQKGSEGRSINEGNRWSLASVVPKLSKEYSFISLCVVRVLLVLERDRTLLQE